MWQSHRSIIHELGTRPDSSVQKAMSTLAQPLHEHQRRDTLLSIARISMAVVSGTT